MTLLMLAIAAVTPWGSFNPDARSMAPCINPTITEGADLVVLSRYEGGIRPDHWEQKHRGEPLPSKDTTIVKANPEGRPVVLVLEAYSKGTWDLSGIPSKRLRGVVSSGFEKQQIVGVAPGVPIKMGVVGGRHDAEATTFIAECGAYITELDDKPAAEIFATLKKAVGHAPARYYGSYYAHIVDIDIDDPGPGPVYSSDGEDIRRAVRWSPDGTTIADHGWDKVVTKHRKHEEWLAEANARNADRQESIGAESSRKRAEAVKVLGIDPWWPLGGGALLCGLIALALRKKRK